MSNTLKDLLGGAVQRSGLRQQMHVFNALKSANTYLDERLPGERRSDAKATSIRDGRLVIECLHGAVAQMIGLETQHLLYRLQSECPQAGVRYVSTKIVQVIEIIEL